MVDENVSCIFTRDHSRIAIITDNNKTYSYGDLFNISKKIGSFIKKRALIFNFCENSIGAISGYLAFRLNNHVSLMLNNSQNKEFVKTLIQKYQPGYMWLKSSDIKFFDQGKILYNFSGYSLLELEIQKETKLHRDLTLLMPTSGSTGSPKYVKLSENNLMSNSNSIIEYLNINESERPITSLPMNYSFGLSIVNSHLLSGSTILLTNYSLLQKEFWSFLKDRRATSLSGTPYHFEILDRLKLDNLLDTNLSIMTHAGGKMRNELIEKIAHFCFKNNKKFFSMYGQTEATARMSFLPPNKLLTKIGSIGVPIPGGKFELIDEVGNLITKSNVKGNLVYRGENVCLGYAQNIADLKIGDRNFKKLYTGDIAKKDSEGFYYIEGRSSRFIKIYGNRINLDDVEEIVSRFFGECACVGVDDLLIIFVKLNSDVSKIKTMISQKINTNYRAIDVRCIINIPRNSSGKILYSELELAADKKFKKN